MARSGKMANVIYQIMIGSFGIVASLSLSEASKGQSPSSTYRDGPPN